MGFGGIYSPDLAVYPLGSPGQLLLQYDFGAPFDTVPANGVGLSHDGSRVFAVHTSNYPGPGWHAVQLSVFAVPNPTSGILTTGSGAVTATTPSAPTPPPPPTPLLSTTDLPYNFGDIAVDDQHRHVFVSSPDSGIVSVLDFSGHVVKTLTGLAGADGLLVVDQQLYVTLKELGDIEAVNTTTLTDEGPIAHGLTAPTQLVTTGGFLWTVSGTCNAWDNQWACIDPRNGNILTGSLYYPAEIGSCTTLTTDPSQPNALFASDNGYVRFDVSTGIPVLVARTGPNSATGTPAFTPDGTRFITPGGPNQAATDYDTSTLLPDGIIYPGDLYPVTTATTPGRGGLVATGLDGIYAPDLFVYPIGDPSRQLINTDFGGSYNTVPTCGVAFSHDGTRVFAVHGSTYPGEGPTSLEFSVLDPPRPTRLTVHANAAVNSGRSVLVEASLNTPSWFAPTAPAELYDGATDLGPIRLFNGRGRTHIALTPGTHDLSAIYQGALDAAPVTSWPTQVTVGHH